MFDWWYMVPNRINFSGCIFVAFFKDDYSCILVLFNLDRISPLDNLDVPLIPFRSFLEPLDTPRIDLPAEDFTNSSFGIAECKVPNTGIQVHCAYFLNFFP